MDIVIYEILKLKGSLVLLINITYLIYVFSTYYKTVLGIGYVVIREAGSVWGGDLTVVIGGNWGEVNCNYPLKEI